MYDISMDRVELFFLVDNAVAEDKYYWLKSSNKEIFELMLRLFYL